MMLRTRNLLFLLLLTVVAAMVAAGPWGPG